MHPSFSIIFFTTASGAGFALLLLVGLGVPLALLPANTGFGFTALAIAFVLAAGGLVSSVFHLGRPERAWRAFSQWRSSWLSREGVMAVATFVPALGFAAAWVLQGSAAPLTRALGLAACAMSLVTVACTAMIYASLKPVHQWRSRWV